MNKQTIDFDILI